MYDLVHHILAESVLPLICAIDFVSLTLVLLSSHRNITQEKNYGHCKASVLV